MGMYFIFLYELPSRTPTWYMFFHMVHHMIFDIWIGHHGCDCSYKTRLGDRFGQGIEFIGSLIEPVEYDIIKQIYKYILKFK